jgi:hypothetical protein
MSSHFVLHGGEGRTNSQTPEIQNNTETQSHHPFTAKVQVTEKKLFKIKKNVANLFLNRATNPEFILFYRKAIADVARNPLSTNMLIKYPAWQGRQDTRVKRCKTRRYANTLLKG